MDQEFIPGIYNYCDRWCERCTLTAHCRVYADEAKLSDDQKDMSKEAFWKYLDKSLQQALDLIQQQMEEMGIDWEELETAGEEEVIAPHEKLPPDHKALHQLSQQYYKKARSWFDERQELFQEKENSLKQQLEMGLAVMPEALRITDALDVINWYSFFLGSKLYRALNGLNDDWMWEDNPIQNDANGSAKITLIAIERSLAAWEVIRNAFPEASDELLDLFLLLGRMRQGIRQCFPNAEAFVRPGFDEPEFQPDKNE